MTGEEFVWIVMDYLYEHFTGLMMAWMREHGFMYQGED